MPESKERKEAKESNETRVLKESRDSKDAKESKSKESKEKDKDSRETKDAKIADDAKTDSNGFTKRKFLFVSDIALIHDLAWDVSKEGHLVKYFVKAATEQDVGDGFVDKVDDWKEHKDWADCIVFDDTGFGEEADKLRKSGKRVVGGSVYSDLLEEDREFGQEELKAAGVNILPKTNFSDFDSAIEFIKKNPGRYVIKPSGHAQSEKELSFIGQEEDGRDLVEMLEHYKAGWSKKIKEFQIQKFASGVEVAVGAFFNGYDFVYPIHVNFEHKRMFPGDIGPNTGEMGTAAFFTQPNKLFQDTLLKMKDRLLKSGYVGYIDVNCIANSRGVYPLEFTSRFGYPTISLQMEGVSGGWGEFLYKLANGETAEIKTKKGFQICVVVAVPPFPFKDADSFRKYSEDATVLFKKPNREGVHLGDVKLSKDGDWHLAGQSGYAVIVTGSGTTMEEARKQAYGRVENIMIPNMFYRTDIGERWRNDGDKLLIWGYL
ncbi:phosphoribosylamine--glycine ligase [Candidatus Micrarchaeota archaeon]|nr:phosphoribosylamine--glycine ligase [Candidatus Micrarchaeota archaeon]